MPALTLRGQDHHPSFAHRHPGPRPGGNVTSLATGRAARRLARPLVARMREVAELDDAVAAGFGAVLSGDAGVGKSALAAYVADRVEAAGEPVERLVATAASRAIAFGALGPLLPADASPAHPALVVDAVRRRLGAAGDRHPRLVVIDDAHLLDGHSAAALLGLVTAGCIRIIATVRTGEAAPDAVTALWKEHLVAHQEVTAFDRLGTQEFLAAMLGGDVATGTASLLWAHTDGNALYLAELARDACANGRLVEEHGVWIWRGGLTLPPRLGDLLERRFDGLAAPGLDALGALVLAEPLPMATLEALASLDGVAELEGRQIVTTSERGGAIWYRFAHPMLAAAAAHQLTPTRRRRVADALIAAAAPGTDALQRAMWQLDGSGVPDVDVLRDGAAAVFLTQPVLALRLVERALLHDPTSRSALLLADVHAELGEIGAARDAQALALTKVRTDDDLLHVRINQVSLTAFSDRRPDVALELLAGTRAELVGRFADEIDSMAAQLLAFSGRPAAALAQAERVLATRPERASAIRASSALVMGLAMTDRTAEALRRAECVVAEIGRGPVTPYAQGIAHMAAQLARFAHWADQRAPATDPSGRWPVPPNVAGGRAAEVVLHPLFEGGRLLLCGHADAAVGPLREAVAQQCVGEGLLRSEAVALLVVALATTGRSSEARSLMAATPPDRVAIYSGLRPWAQSVIEAVEGRPEALSLAFAAYEEARDAGAAISAVAYLSTVARFGAAARAAAELEAWGHDFQSPVAVVRATGILARASGDAVQLLHAAERHAEISLVGDAEELSALALSALGRDRSPARRRAKALNDEMRRRLRRTDTSTSDLLVPLTRRELEIATLAARGMTDGDIAATLIISVRTVESHLAAAYRKLGINSRRALRETL